MSGKKKTEGGGKGGGRGEYVGRGGRKSSRSRVHVQFPAGRPIMVAGPTGCGKTCWVQKLLQCKYNFTEPVRKILYCYGVYQPKFNEMKRELPNIEFHFGLPNKDTVEKYSNTNFLDVIVLDDLMEQIVDNVEAQALFTKYCHHYNISTIFLTQNVMAQGKCARNISLNTLILVLFQNHRDKNQAMILARQQCPRSPDLFLEAFEDATRQAYGYLVVDCTPDCEEKFRWRTHIFKGDPKEPQGKSYTIQHWKPSIYTKTCSTDSFVQSSAPSSFAGQLKDITPRKTASFLNLKPTRKLPLKRKRLTKNKLK